MSATVPAAFEQSPALPPDAHPTPGVARPSIVREIGPAGLLAFVPDLQRLAADAAEPNAFVEPWALLPAVQAFRPDLKTVLVHSKDLLVGAFFVERVSRWRGLPVSAWRTWLHKHSFLGAPLVRRGWAEEAWQGFLHWASSTKVPLLDLPTLPAEGPVHHALAAVLRRTQRASWESEHFVRAMFRPAADVETYLHAALGSKRRKELRRQSNRLADIGPVGFETLASKNDVDTWIRDFLALEARGWKGEDGGALDASDASRTFFAAMVRAGFADGRVELLRMTAGPRTVAMKCNLYAASGGSYAFKIAYDEEHARLSPGVHLEVENIRRLHAARVPWMDSCAAPDHPMIDRLWPDRRAIHHLVVSLCAKGDWLVASLPLLAKAKRRFSTGGSR